MTNNAAKNDDKYTPTAIFDSVEFLKSESPPMHIPKSFKKDYQHAKQFLLSYQYNDETFKSFRRELERFAQYCWFVANKSIIKMKRADIEDYLVFCQKPPAAWISIKNTPRFITKDGIRQPNHNWRPFLVTIPKINRIPGEKLKRRQYHLSEKGFREIFTILNCYYNFLIQEENSEINPILQIKQKNRFYRSYQTRTKIRRVSELQWQAITDAAERMAEREPDKHERTLFIVYALYGMYLRISELTAKDRWTPTMNDFEKDHDGNWWFTTVGKGNKERQIAVSNSMLKALKRWRKHLGLTPALPLASDNSPLLPKQIGHGGLTDTTHIRLLVQACFDGAAQILHKQGNKEEADGLAQATVHWLRHTGISDDVKIRPREHVRDDAGHSSSSITDKYIDISLRERHASAKNKVIKQPEKLKPKKRK